MIVGNWEKLAFPFRYPFLTIGSLTLGAMPIATRIVTDRFDVASATLGNMTAQYFGSAQ